jgi:hypothetical protein
MTRRTRRRRGERLGPVVRPLLACLCLAACARLTELPDLALSVQPRPSAAAAPPLPASTSSAVAVSMLERAPPNAASDTAQGSARGVTVFAGGDVNLGREVGQRLIANAQYAPFEGISALWASADLRFVNLESQLSEQGGETQSPRLRMVFTGPPVGGRALALAGIYGVSTANNHAWDYGRSALFETLDNLRAAGVQAVGTGHDEEEAYRPARFRLNGLSVAVFALTHIWNQGPFESHEGQNYVAWANIKKLRAALQKTRGEVDVLLVSYHGGAEYQEAPSDPTREFAKEIMDAGADAFIGHHPHVIQGVGWQAGRPIFYSLGNLVFGPRPEHPWTRWGMLARVRANTDGTRSFAICPYRIAAALPVSFALEDSSGERRGFLRHVRRASTAVGGTRFGTDDADGCVEVLPPEPRLTSP